MNTYELKQVKRKEKFEQLADKHRDEANRLFEQSNKAVAGIPVGQPILVGHHSEKRHRNTIKKSHRSIYASIEADKKAAYYDNRAKATDWRISGAVVSSDDEDAIKKLQEKLIKLQDKQQQMKTENRSTPKGTEKPFPAWCLQNNNANIRRVAQRITILEKEKAIPEKEPIQGNGYTVTENKEDNRIWIEFDQKPSVDVCSIMRHKGFKWSPSRMAWVRQLNDAGRYAASRIITDLKSLKAHSVSIENVSTTEN